MTDKIIKKILVPTDFSKLSLSAVEYASMIFELQSPKIYLMHVLENVQRTNSNKSRKDSIKTNLENERNAKKQLHQITSQLLSTCGDVEEVVCYGEPFREIVRFAQDSKIDLIVISTHGRTGIAHVLLGSVAEKVVRYSAIPVLTVKPRKVQIKLMEQDDIDEQLHLKLKI